MSGATGEASEPSFLFMSLARVDMAMVFIDLEAMALVSTEDHMLRQRIRRYQNPSSWPPGGLSINRLVRGGGFLR